MNRSVTVEYEGHTYHPFGPDDFWEDEWGLCDKGLADARRRVLTDGLYIDADGRRVKPVVAKVMRRRGLGTQDLFAHARLEGAGKWLIDALWRWGTYPMVAGNPKAGKTTLVADLVAALLVIGRRFLGHFEPADFSVDPRQMDAEGVQRLDVLLINAETSPEDFEAELVTAGVDLDSDWLRVIHLDEYGGPACFDLTNPAFYEEWVDFIMRCDNCWDSDDYWSPSVVIVDGLTAILGDAGKGLDAMGLWYSAFKRLMRECEVPSGLVVGHATLEGGHAMGGVAAQAGPDGLWTYSASNPDDPDSPRWFSVRPRAGGAVVLKSRVVLEEGRLRMIAGDARKRGARTPTEAWSGPGTEDEDSERVTERLRAAGRAGLLTTEVTGRGDEGRIRRAALEAMLKAGLVRSRPEQRGRARGTRWWLTEVAPAD